MPLLKFDNLMGSPLGMAGLGLLMQPQQSYHPINPMTGMAQGMLAANQYRQNQAEAALTAQRLQAEQDRQTYEYQKYLSEQEKYRRETTEEDRKRQELEAAIAALPIEQQAIARLNPEAFATQRAEQMFATTTEPDAVKMYRLAHPEDPTLRGFDGWYRQNKASGIGPQSAPANVQEWQYYSQLTPEQKQEYLAMRRANPYLNLGGEQVQMNPVVPGQRLDSQPVTPRPEDMPEFRGAQAAAVATAEAGVKLETATSGIADTVQMARDILEGKTENLPTQSGIGAATDAAAGYFGITPRGAPEADQLRAIGGALVSKMPRMEGPQSDKDVQTYREMAGQVGDATVPIARRLAALKVVEQLYSKYTSKPSEPETATAANPGEWQTLPNGVRVRVKQNANL